jgi:hypothetical protein
MELKIDELDNPELVNNSTEVNYINYWSNANPTINPTINPKKSKISYDDILSSLNMVVSNGVLQFAKPNPQQNQQNQQQKTRVNQEQEQVKSQKKRVKINTQQQPQLQPQLQPQNNYITNKYFQNYQEQNIINEEPAKPMTKEEYKQMLIQDYINRQQAQIRISQIKSKKLLFDTRNINISRNQMPRDMNKLFKSFITK